MQSEAESFAVAKRLLLGIACSTVLLFGNQWTGPCAKGPNDTFYAAQRRSALDVSTDSQRGRDPYSRRREY